MRHPDSGFVANLDHEQRVRYYEWWRKYLRVKRATWIFGSVMPVSLVLVVFDQRWLRALGVLWPLSFLAFMFCLIWASLLECPRCGEPFRGFSKQVMDDECQNCGLRRAQLAAVAKPQP